MADADHAPSMSPGSPPGDIEAGGAAAAGSPGTAAPPSAAFERGRRQLALLWGAVAILLLALSPLRSWVTGLLIPACPFKSLTGLPCPTCGTTRSAVALAELRIVDAVTTYPLPALAWIALIGGGLVSGLWTLLRGRPPWPASWSANRRWLPWGIGAALLANWIFSIATGV
ncbi:MAG: DUF2752 domain-containing protein [Acidobacteriota bacterium]